MTHNIIQFPKIGVRGAFAFEKFKASTDELVQRLDFNKNMVVNNGLDAYLNGTFQTDGGGGTMIGCAVGQGSKVEEPTDTALDAFLVGTHTRPSAPSHVFQTGELPYYSRRTTRWRFNPGQAVGNISEVAITIGAGAITSSTQIYARQRVRDGAGNPTTITILPDEYLDVVYRHDILAPAEASGTVNFLLDGVSTPHGYVIRPASMSGQEWQGQTQNLNQSVMRGLLLWFTDGFDQSTRAATGAIGPVTGAPAGLITGNNGLIGSASNQAYIAGTFQRAGSVQFPIDRANATVRSLHLGIAGARMQVEYDPPITKINTKQLRYDFIVSVGRA